jgi:glycosyltransferase involved in cell wall biosynthesis
VADLPLRAKRLILWMHDTDVGDRLTPVRAAAFDRIVVLSEWHREHMLARYPFLDADKLVIVGNGVDPERFEHKVPLIKADASAHDVWTSPTVDRRQPHRVVYTSSPDRGLDVILEHIWPSVVEAVPDAELHVYYGWNNFEALRNARPDLAEFQRRVADLTLATRNVVNHGRVTQKVLATELMKSSVWLYPTYFHETYCISAVEAQLAGVIPVTNARAALAETVRAGVIIPEGDVRTQGREYADAVIRLLTDAESREQLRAKVLENAPRLPWELVATFWETDVLGVSD